MLVTAESAAYASTAVGNDQLRIGMPIDTFAEGPVATECSAPILVIRKQPKMIDVDASAVLADMVDRHLGGDVAVGVNPHDSVNESHDARSVFKPSNLCVAVRTY
jgi:hypothetical protein